MDKNLLENYKAQMLKMYNSVKGSNPTSTPVVEMSVAEPEITTDSPPTPPQSTSTGSLIGIVTAIRELYPINNARVTIFTGDYNNDMQIIDRDLTDNSGRTKTFYLPTPERALSLDETNTVLPYSLYNMLIEADGYVKNIHLNIPVFSNVTSLQQSNLILEETAGQDKGPRIFDEAQKYNL
ncbi:MAG: hypothetical protein IJD45_02170 [Clostridia bacterium]|nr:hypothetical protein [Clostridia bacterium]